MNGPLTLTLTKIDLYFTSNKKFSKAVFSIKTFDEHHVMLVFERHQERLFINGNSLSHIL